MEGVATYTVVPPERYAMGTLFIGGSLCVVGMGFIGVMPNAVGAAGGGLLLVLGLVLMFMSILALRDPQVTWQCVMDGAESKITVSADGSEVALAFGSRTWREPLDLDLSEWVSWSDADLAAGLAEVRGNDDMLPVLIAMAKSSRGEIGLETIQTRRWANHNVNVVSVDDMVLEDVFVVGEPDWFERHDGEWGELDLESAMATQPVVEWLRAHPLWLSYLAPV